MLKQIVDERWFTPKAVVGFWPAERVGDDIALFADERPRGRRSPRCTRCASNSASATAGPMSRSPISSRRPRRHDYVGAFVVTAGVEDEAIAKRFEHANDDYSSILVKALADRLAEAFAEAMHARVRRELWGYAPDEPFTPEELHRRALSRHSPGARLSRPARPHGEGDAVPPARRRARGSASSSPRASRCGPASSVSGLYIAHPEAHYFGVAKVERDQVEDYAARKGMPIDEVERWLAPILNYAPVKAQAAE